MGGNFSNLQNLSQDLSELITKRKEDYNRHLASKLNDPQSSPKIFWKILKIFKMGMINSFWIIKKKPIILINSLPLNAHPLIMILKLLTHLFSTQRRGFLRLLVKTMTYLKLSEILGLEKTMVLIIYQSEWSRYVMIPLLNLYQ